MPIDKVDPFWPKPLPNKWILGETVKGGLNMRKELEARALRLQKPKGLV